MASFKISKTLIALSCALLSGIAQAHPIADPGTEGNAVVVSAIGDVLATYQGTSAAYSNDLYLIKDANPLNDVFLFNNQSSPVGSVVNLGSFAVGTQLGFRLHVNNTGYDYFTGLGSLNPDGLPHARVQSNWNTAGTTLVSFEDLYGVPEGQNGYNDLSFSFTNTISAPVPEPETYALMLAGLGLIGVAAKRKKKSA